MSPAIQVFNKYENTNRDLENEEILINLMEEYSQEVMWLAFGYVKDMFIAEDLTQEVFIKIFHNLDTFEGKSSIRTWLFSITINTCKDYLKSSYFKRIIPSILNLNKIPIGKNDTPENLLQTKQQNETLSKHLLSLPLKYREVIILYYFQEFKIREISNLLKINENTIKTRLKKAKIKLADKYVTEGGFE